MSLVTTVADATSDSYCTLLEIESNLYGSDLSAWKAVPSNAEKEAYARRATRLIDMQMYRGELYDEDQALMFPRSDHYVLEDDGVTETPYIHTKVKQALYAQIASLVNQASSGTGQQILDYRAMGVTQINLGGSSISFSGYGSGGSTKATAKDLLCTEARVLLASFFAHSTIRLERG